MYHVLGFLHHLTFSDPQRRLCHDYGKVFDFDTVKLADGDLNRVADVQHDLFLMEKGDSFVFQPPEGDVSFRQEVADDNSAGNLVIGQMPGIPSILLIGGLLVPSPQVNVPALLIGGFDIAVNKAGMVQLHRDFKGNSGRAVNAENLRQQFNPKPLCLLLLIAPAFPIRRKPDARRSYAPPKTESTQLRCPICEQQRRFFLWKHQC